MPLADAFVRSGKVRDLYRVGEDRLLLVACDRLSAFDVVLPTPIPDKGRILTGLSRFWFAQTTDVVANHLVHRSGGPAGRDHRGRPGHPRGPAGPDDARPPAPTCSRWSASSAATCPAPAGRSTRRRGAVSAASASRPGSARATACRTPIFTPAWKAPAGQHDENIPFERVVELIGEELAARVRTMHRSRSTRRGSALCERVGIILADTKFEFGVLPERGAASSSTRS